MLQHMGKLQKWQGTPKCHGQSEMRCIKIRIRSNSKGELAGAFAFGGGGAQAKLLEADGVEVVNGKVDLKKYGI